MTTRTVMVPASVVLTTLVVALGVPSTVVARGRWQDVIAPRGGHATAPSISTESKPITERPRAAAPEADSEPPVRAHSPRIMEHEAGDRLRQALAEAQDDPRSTARIQRLIAQAAAEARRNRALGERVWYWRDPFSENPRQPIVLSLEVQLEMQLWQAREAAARAHIESNSARVEAAAAHAEAARARAVAARAQEAAEKGRPFVARPDSRASSSSSSRAIDEQALLAPPRRPPTTAGRAPESTDDVAPRRRVARRAAVAKTALARNEEAGSPGSRHHDIGAAHGVAAPAAARASDSEEPRTDPATWRSNDPRGIVIVPINATATANAALPRRR